MYKAWMVSKLCDFVDLLESLLYKTVTIYVENYSNCNTKFCGTLFNVTTTYVSMVLVVGQSKNTAATQPPRLLPPTLGRFGLPKRRRNIHKKKPPINFNKQFCISPIIIHPGSVIEIPINKINAVIFYPV